MDSLSNKAQKIKDELEELLPVIDWSISEEEKTTYLKRLSATEDRIAKYKDLGIKITNELKNQRIKYKSKIFDIEEAIQAKKILAQVSVRLNEVVKPKQRIKQSSRFAKFNTTYKTQDTIFSANKAKSRLRQKLGSLNKKEIAIVINEVLNFKQDDKLKVVNDKIISNNNIHFEDKFKMTLATSVSRILNSLDINKKQFTLSEMLELVVLYSIKYFDKNHVSKRIN